MVKYLLLGISGAVLFVAPARAQSVDLSCRMTALEQQSFVTLGYPDNAQQVMHLSVDRHANEVTVWETSPEYPEVNKSVYEATFTGTIAAWAVGDPDDGPQAHDSVDLSTNVLTTIDPDGNASQWNCSGET